MRKSCRTRQSRRCSTFPLLRRAPTNAAQQARQLGHKAPLRSLGPSCYRTQFYIISGIQLVKRVSSVVNQSSLDPTKGTPQIHQTRENTRNCVKEIEHASCNRQLNASTSRRSWVTTHANYIRTYNHTQTTRYRTLHLGKCSKIVNSASSIPLPLVAESILQPQHINTCSHGTSTRASTAHQHVHPGLHAGESSE